MNTKIEIFLGAPVEIESERLFLRRLTSDLESLGRDAIVFANFHLPLNNPVHQIDFLVIVKNVVCHVELKNLTAPIIGGPNGIWHIRMPDGSMKPLERKNPFKQALDCKYAISDAMHLHCSKNREDLQSKKKFFRQIESIVGIYPELCDGSEVTSNQHVRVLGYQDFVELLDTKELAPQWTFDDWKSFAMELGLVQQDLDQTPDSIALENDFKALTNYERRFREIYAGGLSEIVATTIQTNNEKKSSNSLSSCLAQGEHFQFIGPSGCGKSHHAIHASLQAFDTGRIAIFARAKNYRGKLSSLLNESIAHLYPGTALEFFKLSNRMGKSISLVIDGFNECPKELQLTFLKDLLAIYVRWQYPVLITSQSKISLPAELSGSTATFFEPNKEQRLQILQLYSGDTLPENAANLCEAFTSSLELRLAADCIKNYEVMPTRAVLFDSYLRARCGDKLDVSLTRRILGGIADSMRRNLQSRLAVAEVWQIGEKVIDEHGARLTTLQEILQCGFVEFQYGSCTFRHEMFQRYFEAVALKWSARNSTQIAEELRKPQNFVLAEFVVGMTIETEEFHHVLEAASKSNPRLVTDVLLGCFGDNAKSIVVADAKKIIDEANSELETIDVRLNQSDSRESQVLIEVRTSSVGNRDSYNNALINAIGACLPFGYFVDDILRLISNTESSILEVLEKKYGEKAQRPAFLSSLVHQLYVLRGPQRILPAFSFVAALDGCFRCDTKPDVVTHLKLLLDDLKQLSLGELFLLLDLLGDDPSSFQKQLPSLLRHCWNSGIYHLQLKILRRIASWGALRWRSGDCETDGSWAEVVETLQGLQTMNAFVSTELVETLAAFDLLESPFDSNEIIREIHSLLANFDSKEARAQAYSVISNIFEVIGDAYYEAINGLSKSERIKLYTMAALGMPTYSMSGGFIFRELLEHSDIISFPAFRRFTEQLDAESVFPQETTACFIYGFVGCALFMESPPRLADLSNADREAWQVYGEIFFWMQKLKASDEFRSRCTPLWNKLQQQLVFEAVNPLLRFAHATMGSQFPGENPVQRLFFEFQEEIRSILHLAIKRPDAVTSIDKRGNPRFETKSNLTFIVNTLGQIGNEQTVALLVPFVEDDYHGEDAVNAIRKIREGKPFEALSVVFRSG